MTWNYRIMRREHAEGVQYGIHEVYYDEAGEPASWTENTVGVFDFNESGSMKTPWDISDEVCRLGLDRVWMMMHDAFAKPTLSYETGEEI